MKHIIFVFAALILGCSSPKEEFADNNSSNEDLNGIRKSDSLEVTSIVSNFFKAFDEKDLEKMEQILIPESTIIHHNGVITNTKEMMGIIRGTKKWYPRVRQLSKYEFDSDENFAFVGVLNEVTFNLPNDKVVYEPYNETWIFKKTEGKWNPFRIHYSKVIQEKHSEEVE